MLKRIDSNEITEVGSLHLPGGDSTFRRSDLRHFVSAEETQNLNANESTIEQKSGVLPKIAHSSVEPRTNPDKPSLREFASYSSIQMPSDGID